LKEDIRMRLAGLMLIACVGCTSGDTPLEPNGRLCGATLTSNGTFTPDPTAMPNPNGTGCWPYGTWSFSMSIVMNDCAAAPMLLSKYEFTGKQMIDPATGDILPVFAYTTDPSNTRVIVKVTEGGTSGGNGGCEGELDIYSTDGKTVTSLKPQLNGDNTITGDGEYTEYGSNQWPF
jgi:hypothetical protein